MYSGAWQRFFGDHGSQFDISNLDIVNAIENIFDAVVIQLIVN
jgi:hypothetical protein